MPKKLKLHPNERLDLPDLTVASSTYTSESLARDRQEILSGGRRVVVKGFEIELSDQATAPGEVTVWNGVALNSSGEVLQNEESVSDARTVTLSGVNTTFYLEVEFSSALTDVDTRAFLDPQYINVGSVPNGREFSLPVATRESEDWRIATPVSTTGFSSWRMPIAVLTTDGSGAITTAVNPGMELTTLRTNLLAGVSIGATSLQVRDASLFPSSGTVLIGSETAFLTATNTDTNTLTVSALSSAHAAGSVISLTSGSSRWVKFSQPSTPSPTTVDQRERLFSGYEDRGSLLQQSRYSASSRSSTEVDNLKDYVDVLAAQLRELKFGAASGTPSVVPPTGLSSSRWYDFAGGIVPSRTAITIGNGSASIGDLNNSSLSTALTSALLSAPVGSSIVVKPGSYTWDATVTVPNEVQLVFNYGVVITNSATYPLSITSTNRVVVSGLVIDSYDTPIQIQVGANLELYRYAGSLQVISSGATVQVRDSQLYSDAIPAVSVGDGLKTKLVFENCTLQSDNNLAVLGNISESVWRDCVFHAPVSTDTGGSFALTNVAVQDCQFKFSDARPFALRLLVDDVVDNVSLLGVKVDAVSFSSHVVSVDCSSDITELSLNNVVVRDFSPVGATSEGSRIASVYLAGDSFSNVSVQNSDLTQTDFSSWTIGVEVNSSSGGVRVIDSNIRGSRQAVRSSAGDLWVSGCDISQSAPAAVLAAGVNPYGIALVPSVDVRSFVISNTKIHCAVSSFSTNTWTGVGPTTTGAVWNSSSSLRVSGIQVSSVGASGYCRGVVWGGPATEGSVQVLDSTVSLDSLSTGIDITTNAGVSEARGCTVLHKSAAATGLPTGINFYNSASYTSTVLIVGCSVLGTGVSPISTAVSVVTAGDVSATYVANNTVSYATSGIVVDGPTFSAIADSVLYVSSQAVVINSVTDAAVSNVSGGGVVQGFGVSSFGRVIVEGCHLSSISLSGVDATATVKLSNNTITAISFPAITVSITGTGSPNIRVTGNDVSGASASSNCIQVYGGTWTGGTVSASGNSVNCSTSPASGNYAISIVGGAAAVARITDNLITGPTFGGSLYGIELVTVDNALIDSNTLYRSGNTGIITAAGSNITLGTNKLT